MEKNINDKAIQAIIDGVKYYVDNKINSAGFDKTERARIVSVNTDGTYDISLSGTTYYNIKNVGTVCKINDIVNVKIPKNNYSYMYIENFKGL